MQVFCRVTGFTSDFLSFIVVEHIRFFHGAVQFDFLHVLTRNTLEGVFVKADANVSVCDCRGLHW